MADKTEKEVPMPAEAEKDETADRAETTTPYMQEAKLERHRVGHTVARSPVLLVVSTAVIIAAVAAWFYFYG